MQKTYFLTTNSRDFLKKKRKKEDGCVASYLPSSVFNSYLAKAGKRKV
jgi:hypothetical protein